MSPAQCFGLILLVFLCSTTITTTTTNIELSNLLSLKSALENSNPKLFDSWLPTNTTCSFAGISCNDMGNVIGIDLSMQGLFGNIPFETICSLPSLEKLALGFNSLSGVVSSNISRCTRLEYLDLGNNLFSGPFPSISSLSQMKYLYLNFSGFTGVFPWESLSNMSGLVQLSVGDNLFNKTAAFPQEVTKLTRLEWAYLSNSSIFGSIPPAIGNLSELRNLELADNFLHGSIPQEISKLKKLWQLELYDNSLTGELPVGFGNLSGLEYLDVSGNMLGGNLSELRFLKNLISLQMFENNLVGQVPVEFGEFRSLVNLSLYSNNLTGHLPTKLGSWAEVNFISVSANFLSGSIPPDMCKRGTMKSLSVWQNNFSGVIPATYANCTTLRWFRVSQNNLTGDFPSGIWGLPNILFIDIAGNTLNGSISVDISKAKSLTRIFARKNRLSGNLPPEIAGATSMVKLELGENQLTGQLPESIGKLTKLESLQLENNMFSGSIPVKLGDCFQLSDLNLAGNSFYGNIPTSLGSISMLNYLNLSHNELSGPIPNALSSLTFSIFDLSYNQLRGPIPDSFCVTAYNISFVGNDVFCKSNTKHNVSQESWWSLYHDVFLICFVTGFFVLVVCGSCVYFKFMVAPEMNVVSPSAAKDDHSWEMKLYHRLTLSKEQIFESIKPQNIIGEGGSGTFYKLTLDDGKVLAVKYINNSMSLEDQNELLSNPGGQGQCNRRSTQFSKEIQTLSTIRHINVVKLYCSLTGEDAHLLVYEYLPNGSLWDWLHSRNGRVLDWQNRYKIALGVATGLEYLHHWYDYPVIHRNVKSNNILLDEDLKPKIADFGTAKIVQSNLHHDSTQMIAGTPGYMAPEYAYTCQVNEKGDVYSFGVVLIELMTGKIPTGPEFGDSNDIVSWVFGQLKNKQGMLHIIDSGIAQPFAEKAVKVLDIAIRCTDRSPENRPTMQTVVQMLIHANH